MLHFVKPRLNASDCVRPRPTTSDCGSKIESDRWCLPAAGHRGSAVRLRHSYSDSYLPFLNGALLPRQGIQSCVVDFSPAWVVHGFQWIAGGATVVAAQPVLPLTNLENILLLTRNSASLHSLCVGTLCIVCLLFCCCFSESVLSCCSNALMASGEACFCLAPLTVMTPDRTEIHLAYFSQLG